LRRRHIDHRGEHRQRGAEPSRGLQACIHFQSSSLSRGTSNKRVNHDEVREGYSGASIAHLELVLLQAASITAIKQDLELVLV
jgi:hypothetical protein